MMYGCPKCRAITAVLVLLLGVALLLVDLGVWKFWNIQWWTGLLLVMGVTGLAMRFCSDCQAMCK